jgi:hypothetical protein
MTQNNDSSQQNTRSRIHIQKRLADCDVTLNVFGNDPAETYALFKTFQSLVNGEPPTHPNQAQREMANAEAKASAVATAPAAAKPVPKPQAKAKGATPANAPPCNECGSTETMELIRWKDKETGEGKTAWKCQSCNVWWRSW